MIDIYQSILIFTKIQQMAKFKIGDVVRLNSGGPIMTVRDNDSERLVTCNWFEYIPNLKNSLEVGTFHEDQLSKNEES